MLENSTKMWQDTKKSRRGTSGAIPSVRVLRRKKHKGAKRRNKCSVRAGISPLFIKFPSSRPAPHSAMPWATLSSNLTILTSPFSTNCSHLFPGNNYAQIIYVNELPKLT